MAPMVLAVYTRAASVPVVDVPPDATASASGNVAPSASVIGSSSKAVPAACLITRLVNPRFGSVTWAATMSGILVAATYAAAEAATDDIVNIAASHTAGRALRRTTRAPAADPIASPAINAAAIVAKAYGVGPITSASSRVHATPE